MGWFGGIGGEDGRCRRWRAFAFLIFLTGDEDCACGAVAAGFGGAEGGISGGASKNREACYDFWAAFPATYGWGLCGDSEGVCAGAGFACEGGYWDGPVTVAGGAKAQGRFRSQAEGCGLRNCLLLARWRKMRRWRAGRVITAAAAGQTVQASEDTFQRRMKICTACEFLDKASQRCGKCGCFVAAQVVGKARLATERCPVNKW